MDGWTLNTIKIQHASLCVFYLIIWLILTQPNDVETNEMLDGWLNRQQFFSISETWEGAVDKKLFHMACRYIVHSYGLKNIFFPYAIRIRFNFKKSHRSYIRTMYVLLSAFGQFNVITKTTRCSKFDTFFFPQWIISKPIRVCIVMKIISSWIQRIYHTSYCCACFWLSESTILQPKLHLMWLIKLMVERLHQHLFRYPTTISKLIYKRAPR